MRKIIAAINMSLDGYCDHTAMTADEEIHRHYADLLRGADAILYGRTTYHLMEYWPTVVQTPTGNPAIDDFALVMDAIPKIVFSTTLQDIEWDSARLANRPFAEVVKELKQQPGRDVLIGSRSLIIAGMNLNLIDEYQICIHPVVVHEGLPLFNAVDARKELRLVKTKTFGAGAILLYYQPKDQ